MADKTAERQLSYGQWLSRLHKLHQNYGHSKNMYINPNFYKQTINSQENTSVHFNPKFINVNINKNSPTAEDISNNDKVINIVRPQVIDSKTKPQDCDTLESHCVTKSKLQLMNTADRHVINKGRSEINKPKSQFISTTKYKFVNTANTLKCQHNTAEPQVNYTSKYQAINTSKPQILSTVYPQVLGKVKPEFISTSIIKPVSTSKYKVINTTKSNINSNIGPEHSTTERQLENTVKPNVICTSKPHAISTPDLHVLNKTKHEIIRMATPEVISTITSQFSNTSKHEIVNKVKSPGTNTLMPQVKVGADLKVNIPKSKVIHATRARIVLHNSKYTLVRNRQTMPQPTVINKSADAINNKYKFVKNSSCSVKKEELCKTNKIAPLPSKITVTVNKYKSINVNDLKSVIANEEKHVIHKPIETHKPTTTTKRNRYKITKTIAKTPILKKNQYKYVKTSNKTLNNSLKNVKAKTNLNSTFIFSTNISLNKSVMSTSFKKCKPVKGNFKINNIPCPLFRKFGKCIRKQCDFLHDKKHVSICRKFIKGLCHDSSCLLSHELSSNKLPTCYFYLNAMCTKVGCPYLHVKLNDNATICKNFLKGYCENGVECLQRHIAPIPKKIKGMKIKANKVKRVKRESKIAEPTETKGTVEENAEEESLSRYYENAKNNEESNDNIKPTRCKLGTLPSFIKL